MIFHHGVLDGAHGIGVLRVRDMVREVPVRRQSIGNSAPTESRRRDKKSLSVGFSCTEASAFSVKISIRF